MNFNQNNNKFDIFYKITNLILFGILVGGIFFFGFKISNGVKQMKTTTTHEETQQDKNNDEKDNTKENTKENNNDEKDNTKENTKENNKVNKTKNK